MWKISNFKILREDMHSVYRILQLNSNRFHKIFHVEMYKTTNIKSLAKIAGEVCSTSGYR